MHAVKINLDNFNDIYFYWPMRKKVLLSLLSGFIILIITWIYQANNFSFFVEDTFFRKFSFWKYQVFNSQPEHKAQFVFLNTGKDIAIINDSAQEYGSVAVSQREKIYELLKIINDNKVKPRYTVLDIQFYFPYSANPVIDTLLQNEIKKNAHILIPILKGPHGNYQKPLYDAQYAYSGYETFGIGFNKFRIWNHDSIHSMPVVLNEKLDHAIYKDHLFYTTCNGHLCFTAIWPSFYLLDNDLKENKTPLAQSYNLGEALFSLEANPADYAKIFKDKIVIIGNFRDDVHSTAVGTMSGSAIVANIYLSILNNQHLVSYFFLILLFLSFSLLSYMAWFSKMPEIKIRLRFIFAPDIIKFISGYISYFGSMFVLSLVALLVFNMHVALFLPASIFAGIEYFRQKKYLPKGI